MGADSIPGSPLRYGPLVVIGMACLACLSVFAIRYASADEFGFISAAAARRVDVAPTQRVPGGYMLVIPKAKAPSVLDAMNKRLPRLGFILDGASVLDASHMMIAFDKPEESQEVTFQTGVDTVYYGNKVVFAKDGDSVVVVMRKPSGLQRILQALHLQG